MSTKFASNRKRVTLNRKPSISDEDQEIIKVEDIATNDYTRQLVESALSRTNTPLIVPAATTVAALNGDKKAAINTAAIVSPTPTPISNSSSTPHSLSRLHLLLEKNNKNGGDKPPLIAASTRLAPLSTLKPSLRTPNSAPCTPVAKSVHFDNNLENICLFRKAQTPSAIRQRSVFWANNNNNNDEECLSSSSTSSDDEDDDDISDPEDDEKDEEEDQRQLFYANWPNRLADILNKKDKIIRVEKNNFRLDNDSDTIVGKVLVRNLDYHKTVMIRYTFDFWETVENIQAIYRESSNHKVYDVFGFSIDHVSDHNKKDTTSKAQILYFAVCYNVGGKDYWDNNDGKNYEIQIIPKNNSNKKSLSGSLNTTATTTSSISTNTKAINDDKSLLLSEPPLTTHKKEDGLSARYNFGQSIHQAKKPPTATTLGFIDSYQQQHISHHHHYSPPQHHHHHHHHQHHQNTNNNKNEHGLLHRSSSSPSLSSLSSNSSNDTVGAMPIPRRKASATAGRDSFPLFSSSPTCHSPLSSSPNSLMDLNSQSYMDLVNKYCFYSTSPSRSPMSING